MVEIISEIPAKEARMVAVPQGRPEIFGIGKYTRISYPDGTEVPRAVLGDFLGLCDMRLFETEKLPRDEIRRRIALATRKKNIRLRFADERPLGAVSRFEELDLRELAGRVGKYTGTEPLVRYFSSQERVHLHFPLTSSMHPLYMLVDSGRFGVYGGSGHNAFTYGLSWEHGGRRAAGAGWALFLGKTLGGKSGRGIHIEGDKLPERLEQIVAMGPEIDRAIAESRDRTFTRGELDAYLDLYTQKGLSKKIAWQFRGSIAEEASAYNLATRISMMGHWSGHSDTTRIRAETIAGELILCYEQIKEAINNPGQTGKKI